MKLYLDDDSAAALLARLLQQAGHDVLVPADFGLSGAKDAEHLRRAIREQAAFVSHNYEDFELLHELLMEGQGHHPGILVVRKDNDPSRDLKPPGIVRAIRNLEGAGIAVVDQYTILNHWR
jgi:hypothetical protein